MCVNLVGISGGWRAMIEQDMAGSLATAAEPVRLDQFLLNWRKQATLIAGVRVEDSSVFGVDTNPRVAASYTLPWTQTKLRGGYATGIRAPELHRGIRYRQPLGRGQPQSSTRGVAQLGDWSGSTVPGWPRP